MDNDQKEEILRKIKEGELKPRNIKSE